MPRLAPDVSSRPKAALHVRPIPRSLMEVYYWTEDAFRQRAAALEDDPRFQSLIQRGVLEKVRFRGKIPRHKYEDFKDRELTEFFHKYQVARNPGWEADFFDPRSMSRRHELARRYGVPVGELVRVLRYLGYVNELTDGGPARAIDVDSESGDFLRFTPSEELFDMSPIVTKLDAFARRYGLDRERFAAFFFSDKRSPDEICSELGCSREEVDRVRALVDRVQTVSSLQLEIGPSRPADAKPGGDRGRKAEPVAEVFLDTAGDPRLRLLSDDLYDVQYRFHTQDSAPLSREETDLVQELKAINQRKTVLVRLVTYLFKYQYRYLATGRLVDLVPLTQARLARELDEEEATVSRLIRDKTLRTPWGTFPLKTFFVKVGRMVEILLTVREAEELAAGRRTRPYTDLDIRGILQREYGVDLSRRSITYHRNRTRGPSNFYARKRKLKA